MNTIRAVFLDAVGTLIHPEPAARLVYAEAGRRFGSGYTAEIIAERFGRAFEHQEGIDRANGWTTSAERERRRWREIVAAVLDDVACPSACFDFLYSHFAKPEAWRCEPGAEALCEELTARGIQLGLASNFDERLYPLVQGLTPLHCFGKRQGAQPPVMVVSFEEGFRKPARQFFELMCRRTGLEPANILHVGDDPVNDYAGAVAVGMPAVLFDPRGKYQNWTGPRIRTLADVKSFASPDSRTPLTS